MGLFGRKKTTVGLDIGSGLVKVAVVDHSKKQQELVKVAVVPLPASVATTPGALAPLAEAFANAGINVTSLYLAVGEGSQPMLVLGCSDPQKGESMLASWGA